MTELVRHTSGQGMRMDEVLKQDAKLRALLAPPQVRTSNNSVGHVAWHGWAIIALFFGLFGLWSVTAPLNGAVIAAGVVKVDGNRKSIQHLDGGLVRELRVKDGDRVSAGDVLVVLDDSQARAEFEVLTQQYMVLRFTEERLRAELAHATVLEFPADLVQRKSEPDVDSTWRGQQQQFEIRKKALEGQRNIISEKITQLQAQIKGAEAQIKGNAAQKDSIVKEKDSLTPLLERGLVTRPRVLQLERSAAGLDGQIGDLESTIARARQAIAEQEQQALQLDHDRASDVAKELRETQARLLEVIPRLTNAQASVGRMVVRSPYSGQIVGLNVFSVGAVIGRGEKIMDVVPDRQSLVIEAQVGVDDIADVHPDMRAEVQLTAYKQRTTPVVHGDVIQVSADRLVDNKSNAPYYIAQVRIDEHELADLPHVRLYPGMQAVVLIPTVQRTAFDYFVGPLVMSFQQAFRQK